MTAAADVSLLIRAPRVGPAHPEATLTCVTDGTQQRSQYVTSGARSGKRWPLPRGSLELLVLRGASHYGLRVYSNGPVERPLRKNRSLFPAASTILSAL